MVPRQRSKGRRVMVVDDEVDTGMAVARAATSAGFEVLVVNDPEDFEDSFDSFDPDAVILDIVMPQRDGIEILRSMVSTGRVVPVLAISGYNARYLDAAEKIAEAHRLTRIVTKSKPVRLDEIRAFLAEVAAAKPPDEDEAEVRPDGL